MGLPLAVAFGRHWPTLGFGGIAGAAVGIAKFLFWAGIIIAVVLFLIGMSVAKKV
ncbi:DUF1328 domain-containing protein, partial [Stenotrophomonas sp. 3diitr2024]|uniref:DUF1328 domain-containing protein n=1 Tax=Stenotrophomonas sp. 3diitr2024 TaxID=3345115 RepID=UPI0035CC8A15